MALTQALKEIYSNYNETRQFYDTVQMYHPNFNVTQDLPYPSETSYPGETEYPSEINKPSQSFFLVRDTADHSFKLEDGSTQTFYAYPFNIIQPEIGSDQQDIGIVLDNVSLELISAIELASENQSVPIQMTFRVYIDGDDTPQITPIVLGLTELSVDMRTVTCKASRVDLNKRKFPFGKTAYFDQRFQGLYI